MNDNIMISIIVPIYKVEKELERCVNSLVNQTYKNIEIILVDDGSPDNCPQICDRYALTDKRIVVIHKENGGLSDARNAGLLNARGEFILFVDSDDYIELDSCEKFALALHECTTEIVIGVAKEKEIKGKEHFMKHSNLLPGKVYKTSEYIKYSICKNEWYAPVWLNLYQKQFLLKNNLYFAKGILHEDMEFLPRFCFAAKNISYMDYQFYNYIIRKESITTVDNKSKNAEDSIQILSEWKELFDNIKDEELKIMLYGILIKYYLKMCRNFKIINWEVKGVDFHFSWRYALNIKEKLKVLLFNVAPQLYIQL